MSYNNNLCQDYLKSIIEILKEEAFEAKHQHVKEKKKNSLSEKTIFQDGYSLAYHRFISLLQMQAEAFDIPLSELSLDDIDPDKDLL